MLDLRESATEGLKTRREIWIEGRPKFYTFEAKSDELAEFVTLWLPGLVTRVEVENTEMLDLVIRGFMPAPIKTHNSQRYSRVSGVIHFAVITYRSTPVEISCPTNVAGKGDGRKDRGIKGDEERMHRDMRFVGLREGL